MVAQLRLQRIDVARATRPAAAWCRCSPGCIPKLVARMMVEDVGPERPDDIASGFARRVKQEAEGWASEDELVAQLKTENPGVAAEWSAATRISASSGAATAVCSGSGIPIWSKGFVVTELWRYVSRSRRPTIYILGGRSTIVPAETQGG